MKTLPQDFKISIKDIPSILSAYKLLISKQNDSASADHVNFSTDSRKASKTCGFIAYQGVASDGNQYIDSAAKSHAAFIIAEKSLASADAKIPFFLVTSARAAWSVLTAEACGNPQKKLKMMGVTGTNGKTSTAWMTHQLLQLAGEKTVMIGTLGAYIGEEFYETKHTTPDPDVLYPLLQKAVQDGAKSCIMEVSSHAIAQDKLTPVTYNSAAFTSFSRDHLDFHSDEEDYWQTKCKLFNQMLVPGGEKIICAGLSKFPVQKITPSTIIYGLEGISSNFGEIAAQFIVSVDQETFQGSDVRLHVPQGDSVSGHVPFFGSHALENFSAALLLSASITRKIWIPSLWSQVKQVPGRLEKVEGHKKATVFVDYAHTPDALEKTLLFLKKYKKTGLTCIFGCGGDRDAGKRPIMGAIAAKNADVVYITSDNPRSENPGKIISDIANGIPPKCLFFKEPDRKTAIKMAIEASNAEDIILIAGKGHETYQIIGNQTLPFDDRKIALEYLNQ